MLSKKVLGEKLADANSLQDHVKLGVGVSAGTLLFKYLPIDPFKSV